MMDRCHHAARGGRTSDGNLTAMALNNNEKKKSRVTKDESDLTKRRTPDDVRASKSDRTGHYRKR
jgi:hypothetical protein